MGNIIISLGRQFGSGGKEIGTKLAQKMNVKCYDNELLAVTARESGYCEEVLQKNDEKTSNSFLYSLAMDSYSGYTPAPLIDMPLNHRIFLAQFEAIKNLAEKESCIIVGRCADYVLADNPGCISVFIHANINFRLQRVKEANLDRAFKDDGKIIDFINKTDRKRSNYYNYYSGKRWGDAKNYDLCIDSSVLGIDGTVDLLLKYLNMRFPDLTIR